METGIEPRSCAKCKKFEAFLPNPLKRCSKCKETLYCSHDCQKADWKMHKRSYAQYASYMAINTSTGRTTRPFSTFGFTDPFANDALQLDTLPEKDAFARIIDSYCLRMEDELNYGGQLSGLYSGEDPVADFRGFLSKAEAHGGCLPAWWSGEKSATCLELAMSRCQWSCVERKITVTNVEDHYGDPVMPTKLRVWSERAIGHKVLTR